MTPFFYNLSVFQDSNKISKDLYNFVRQVNALIKKQYDYEIYQIYSFTA